MAKVACLICEHPEAEDLTSGGYDGKQIRCPRCERYDVAGSALAKLAERDREHREAALAKAKVFSGDSITTITSMCF